MHNRRDFIKRASGMAVLAGLALPNLNLMAGVKSIPEPGTQLFTFFNVIDDDVKGTLTKAADIGLKNIESAFSKKGDYYGLSAKDFSSLLKSLGMRWRSHHVFGVPLKLPEGSTMQLPAMKNLTEHTDQIISDALAGGVEYLVAAHLPIGTDKEINSSLDLVNKTAEATKKAGIQLIYHNEASDFKQVDGKIPYEVFLTQTDKDALKFELDIAWAIKGGTDPVNLIKRYPGRFPLWHIKDLDKTYETVLPVGKGVLNYTEYFKHAKASGLKYYFIEHEAAPDPFGSLATSIADIRKITK